MKSVFIHSRKQIKLLWFLPTYIYAFGDMFIIYQMIIAHFKNPQIIYDWHLNINCGPQTQNTNTERFILYLYDSSLGGG